MSLCFIDRDEMNVNLNKDLSLYIMMQLLSCIWQCVP